MSGDIEHGQGTCLGWYGAEYIDARDVWEHNFKLVTTSRTRSAPGYSDELIYKHGFHIETFGAASVWENNSHEYFGYWPETDDTQFDYAQVMKTVGEWAISEINEKFNYALDIYQLGNALVHNNKVNHYDTSIDFSVDYGFNSGNQKQDTSHYQWFLIDHSGPDSSDVSVETTADTGYTVTKNNYVISLWTDSATKQSISSTSDISYTSSVQKDIPAIAPQKLTNALVA